MRSSNMLSEKLFYPLSNKYLIILTLFIHFCVGSTIDHNPDNVPFKKLVCAKRDPKCNSTIETCETEEVCDEQISCFMAWEWISESSGTFRIIHQGCWSKELKKCEDTCVMQPDIGNRGIRGKVGFCCCIRPMCNGNFTVSNFNTTSDPPSTDPSPTTLKMNRNSQLVYTLLYSIVPIVALVLIILGIFVLWRFYIRENRYHPDHRPLSTADPELDTPPSPHPLRPVQLIELRAHGRFADVWKAAMMDQSVAVKIMTLKEKASWITEQEIYKLPQMKHDNILLFHGAEKRGEELWLLTEFHDNGSLSDYLKGNTVTWGELCKIAETMMCGLAYLHNEIPSIRGIEGKPAVAHRDFKSKNVLLKNDLSVCIADFGLAITFEPGKSLGETHGLVGTRRYMAPEVLEGAISFNRDAFLRIDMYATGLVIWELMSRCSAVDGPVDDYQLPYEEEIGSHPTLEDLQELVVMKKIRPTIKEHWMHHSGLEALCPTIEECWDQDAEARVSADCVHERLLQIGRTLNVNITNNTMMTSSPNQISMAIST